MGNNLSHLIGKEVYYRFSNKIRKGILVGMEVCLGQENEFIYKVERKERKLYEDRYNNARSADISTDKNTLYDRIALDYLIKIKEILNEDDYNGEFAVGFSAENQTKNIIVPKDYWDNEEVAEKGRRALYVRGKFCGYVEEGQLEGEYEIY